MTKQFRFQFTLGSLMATPAVVAFACAAFRFPSDRWASATFTVTLGLMCSAILLAVCLHGWPRTFWLGFVVAGGMYLLLAFGPWFTGNVTPYLLTTRTFSFLHSRLDHSMSPRPAMTSLEHPDVANIFLGQSNHVRQASLSRQSCAACHTTASTAQFTALGLAPVVPSPENTQRIGHSLFAVLVALAGALLASYCAARRSTIADAGTGEREQPAEDESALWEAPQ